MEKELYNTIVEYWLKLLPQTEDVEQLNQETIRYWGHSLEEILKNYEKTSYRNVLKNHINNRVSEGKKRLYNRIFDKVTSKYKWPNFLRIFLYEAEIRLHEIVQNSAIIEHKDKMESSLFEALFGQCYELSFKVILQEFYYAKQENRLQTENETMRQVEFNNLLLDIEYVSTVYNTYPELTRLLLLRTDRYIQFVSEILKHTQENIKIIQQKINPFIRTLEEIQLDAGDSHNSGRTVCILRFNDEIKIVYKPRRLDSEEAFFHLLDYLNQNSIKGFRKLRQFKYHTIADCGWVEFIEYEPCDELQQIKDYYVRMGELLCILYLLNAKDFHSENVISYKDQPMLIDFETLLHAMTYDEGSHLDGACQKALDLVNNSVLKTGLLPMQILNPKTGKRIEIGAMGKNDEQESPFYSWGAFEDETGNIYMKRFFSKISFEHNCPILKGEKQQAYIFLSEIVRGFDITYRFLDEHKFEFATLIQRVFHKITGRIIIRPTNVYDQLLKTSFHPDLLVNEWNRKLYLIKILGISNIISESICESEIKDLYDGDIPFFTCKTDDMMLWDIRGKYIPNSIQETMLKASIDKVRNMNSLDRMRQIAFIRVSFLDDLEQLGMDNIDQFIDNTTVVEKPRKYRSYHEILKRLFFILEEKCIADSEARVNRRTWLEVNRHPDWPTYVSYVGADLYSGLTGLCLLYDGYCKYGDSSHSRQMLQELQYEVLDELENLISNNELKLGAFTGLFGVVYLICKRVDVSPELIPILCNMIRQVSEKRVQEVDIMDGAAGIIKVLLLIKDILLRQDRKYPQEIHEIYVMMCDLIHLIKEKSLPCEDGTITWGEEGYVGYAHGTAGIVDALVDYYEDSRDQSIVEYIQKGYHYISLSYNSNEKNWMKDRQKNCYARGWCHGAPGIALLQINLNRVFGNEYVNQQDLKVSASIIIQNGFGHDYCICHGDMGNLMILNRLADWMNDSNLLDYCKRKLSEVVNGLEGKIYGEYFYFRENWSLMLGLPSIAAGILDIEQKIPYANILVLK